MDRIQKIDQEIAELKNQLSLVKGQETEVYSRIVGYYRSVGNWNFGKKEEYKVRQTFQVGNMKLNTKQTPAETTTASETESQSLLPEDFTSYTFFYRTTCPNCGPMKEVINSLEMTGSSLNVDTEEGLNEASKLNIFSAPTVVLFDRDGKEIFRTGSPSELSESLLSHEAIA